MVMTAVANYSCMLASCEFIRIIFTTSSFNCIMFKKRKVHRTTIRDAHIDLSLGSFTVAGSKDYIVYSLSVPGAYNHSQHTNMHTGTHHWWPVTLYIV